MNQSEKFWDKRAEHYDDTVKKHDAAYRKTIARSRSLLTDSDVVLDFACASGEMALDIAPHVQQVQGIDLSKKMIELASQKVEVRQLDNINFEQTELFDPKLTNYSFSAIMAFNIFHLVDDAPKVLARLRELLATNGLLISQTPCLSEQRWLFRTAIAVAQRVGVVPTVRSFTVTELEALISSSHFEIVEAELWDEKNVVQWIVARKI